MWSASFPSVPLPPVLEPTLVGDQGPCKPTEIQVGTLSITTAREPYLESPKVRGRLLDCASMLPSLPVLFPQLASPLTHHLHNVYEYLDRDRTCPRNSNCQKWYLNPRAKYERPSRGPFTSFQIFALGGVRTHAHY